MPKASRSASLATPAVSETITTRPPRAMTSSTLPKVFSKRSSFGASTVQGTDLLGDGVNVAARLQGVAEPGGICISGSVYDQVLNKLSLSFKPLGEFNYKNLPQPVRTFAIARVAGLGVLPSPARRRQLANGFRSRRFVIAALLLITVGGVS